MARLLLLIPFVVLSLVGSSAEARRASVPYLEPDEWPFVVESEHFVVHYQAAGEVDVARLVSDALEDAWHQQIEVLGAPEPLGDAWAGDPDPRLDAFLWRGIDTMYVDEVVEASPVTDPDIDDAATYLVLDPWGQYGLAASEEELRANVYHELRHTIQARFDWWEDYWFFEAEATFWEARSAFGWRRLAFVWADVQARTEWSPFFVDDYRTWFMYGGALYFDFLSHRHFGGGIGFTDELWARCANAPGAEFDPLANEPDFADGLEAMLPGGLVASVIEFARARWYTGGRARPGRFSDPAAIAEIVPRAHRRTGSAKTSLRVDAMTLGTSYVSVERGAKDPQEIWVSLKADGARVVQTVGRDDGDAVLDLSSGRARLRFGVDGKAHLAVTVLPGPGWDPDAETGTRYATTLAFDR
jgi:hypothetical protein